LGDAMTFDENGITTIWKNPIFRKKSLIFDDSSILMSSLTNHTNYIFGSGENEYQFTQHVIFGQSVSGRFSINEDVTIQLTNETKYPI
jgi:hypothetical protein